MSRHDGHTRRYPRARRAWLNRRGLIDRSQKTSFLYGRAPVVTTMREGSLRGRKEID